MDSSAGGEEGGAGAGLGGGDAGWCRVLSENMLTETEAEGEVRFRADEALSPGEPGWANYVKGVVKEFMAWVSKGGRQVPSWGEWGGRGRGVLPSLPEGALLP